MSVDAAAIDFAIDELPGAEMHQALRRLREEGPVRPARFLGLPAFVVTGYDALLEAFKDSERFPPHRMYQVGIESVVGPTFISTPDPTEHRLYRKLATPAFRSRAIERYEQEGLIELAQELIGRIGDASELDLMGSFVSRYPYLVITRLLGLPHDREDDFHRWALAMLRLQHDPAGAMAAAAEFTEYLAPIVAARRREPREDVISGLAEATVEGAALTDEEIYSHVRLLFPTGGETTHGSLGNLVWAVLSHDGLWESLARAPEKIPAAIDELLRWESSIAVLPRMSASEPIELRGVEIPADSWVLFAIAGANRDPAVFSDPDTFDIERDCGDALTFGRGVKSCPGMHLARKNMRVALETLLERWPSLTLIDAEAARPRRAVLRCPDALRVAPGTA